MALGLSSSTFSFIFSIERAAVFAYFLLIFYLNSFLAES